MLQLVFLRGVLFLFLASLGACTASTLKQTQATDQEIQKINLLAVQFHRPVGEAAAVDDFTRHQEILHCESPHQLWLSIVSGNHTTELIECLNSLGDKKEASVFYHFRAKDQPSLLFEAESGKPQLCLGKLLPELPLPREIYFLARKARSETRAQQTYSMSLDTHAGQGGVESLIRDHRFEIEFHFPMKRKLKSSQDLEIWLLVSVLKLFDRESGFRASLVPDPVEQKCFSADARFSDKKLGKIPPLFWP